MTEFKFKKFDFRNFMDFILVLADYHELGQVRFFPEHKELFDEVQLTHIAPHRSIDDRKGFAWAWSKKQDEVRKVSIEQFSKDDTKKVKMAIDLDKKSVVINEINGVSPEVISDLLKEKFGNYTNDLIKEKIYGLEKQIRVLEFCAALFFSICFTLIFAIVKIGSFRFNWLVVGEYFIMFFGIAILVIYIILPIIEVIKKVGLGVKDIGLEFFLDFKYKTKLDKVKSILSIILGISSIISFIFLFAK